MQSELLEVLLKAIEMREAVALVTVTAGDGAFSKAVGNTAVVWPDTDRRPFGDLGLGESLGEVLRDARLAIERKKHEHFHYKDGNGNLSVFVEVQARPPHLIIAGAGHIAIPLASIAKTCEFQVSVIDDRPQYAHAARFPTADRAIAGPFRPTLQALRQGQEAFDSDTYVVLVTRGHQHDIDCLLEVLDDPVAYLGMIGSQRRIRAVFELLEKEQNIPASKFDDVRAPIGIDIGAITPAEIAVCIMAEIICVLREGRIPGLSEQIQAERIERRNRAATRAKRL